MTAFNPVDVHVGSRVREARLLLGLSQDALGKLVGVTFQQQQKRERGANRVAASTLHLYSRILGVPVEWFFAEMPEVVAGQSPRAGVQTPAPERPPDLLRKRETLELVRAYYRIEDPKARAQIFGLVKTLGAAASQENEGHDDRD